MQEKTEVKEEMVAKKIEHHTAYLMPEMSQLNNMHPDNLYQLSPEILYGGVEAGLGRLGLAIRLDHNINTLP